MIGYYAHHHGSGHLVRAVALAEHVDEPVTLLSSLEPPPGHPFADVVALPLDDGGHPAAAVLPGLAHHAPLASPGLAGRMAAIAAFLATHTPARLVVDVSVEVTLLARLCGAHVVVVRQHGDRDDEPHRQAYRAAARLVAPWPWELDEGEDDPWARRTTFCGGFSRLQHRVPRAAPRDGTVVLLGGRGGGDAPARAARAIRAAEPGRPLVVLGPGGDALPPGVEHLPWVQDPWDALQRADVVVATASHNSVMDAAAAGRPLVVVADERPHDEQLEKARRLQRLGAAEHVPDPAGADWAAVLARAGSRGGAAAALLAPDGARAFARAIRDGLTVPGGTAPVAGGPPEAVPVPVPVSVCTLVHGRLDHLAAQHASLRRHAPDAEHVVAWMGGPDPHEAAPGARIVRVPGRNGAPLPLAAARNAATAAAAGEVVVLLDVDCVVEAATVQRLAAAARRSGGVVLPRVLYATGHDAADPADEHPARRVPPDEGPLVPCPDWGLAWTVALALPAGLVEHVGGFDEAYTGYGAEDTDFAWRCRAAGVPLHWATDATVRHLPHEGSGVPYDRAPDVVRNALRFHRTWGHWPMLPWLRAFAARGLLGAELTEQVAPRRRLPMASPGTSDP